MKRFFNWLKRLFFPPQGSTRIRRILPFGLLVVILLLVLLGGIFAWEETNTTQFCGTACHTMPPQFVTHKASPHVNLTCEDCHLGRAPLFESIRRKAVYSWQTGTAMVFNTYHYPIFAKNMSPATESCIPCHDPGKFSSDKLVDLKDYAQDDKNTQTTTYLILKTGGGSSRQGLGFGIHWHIENPVYFYATDEKQQDIPYIKYKNAEGKTVEYVDVESKFDPKSIKESQLIEMDCITCHNRTAHDVQPPDEAINQMMTRNLISPSIPEIRKQAYAVVTATYKSQKEALFAIEGLLPYYQSRYSEFYDKNETKVKTAVSALKSYYQNSVFFDQKMDWNTHPDNIGHKDSAGCFRCHDGKHLTALNEAVRLECNICHSVPVVSTGSNMVSNIPVSKGIEPTSHLNVNWITLHRQVFDSTCASCHTVDDPGGKSNTSFCSNSGCHAQSWKFAGFDAPTLREKLKDQLPKPATPTVAPTKPAAQTTPAPQTTTAPAGGKLTWANVADLFAKCTACHKAGGSAGLDLSSYKGAMTASKGGAQIVAGDPDKSPLIQVQKQGHFVKFTDEELAKVSQWIKDGALEK